MAAFRSIGLPAALLAATGGVALATWRYLSARRAKGEEQRVQGEGSVEVVSAQDGGEPGISIIDEGARQVCRAGDTEGVSPVQTEGGSTGSDRNVPPGTSPAPSIIQEEKSAAGTSITPEKKSTAAADTSITPEKKSTAAADTSITPEKKKSTAAADTYITPEKKNAAAPVTPVTLEEEKSAAFRPVTLEEESATAEVISVIQQEKKSGATAVTSMTPEKKIAAASVTFITLEEESTAAEVISVIQEEKRAAAPVNSITHGEEKSANPTSATSQEDVSILHETFHIVESSTIQEQYKTSSVLTEKESPTSPRSPPDKRMEEGFSDTMSSADTQHKEKQASCKQVLVLGLDGSGKTSVLNCISANKGKLITTPTEGVNAMCISNGNSKMEFLEIGGSEHLRPYWKMYLSRAFAVIFVVDSADHGRLSLAKRHLHQLIQQDPVLPLIVLANKQDLQNAHHIPEIHDALALSEICENRKLFLIGTYVTKDGSEISSGIQDTKEFLAQLLVENSAKVK